jgi:hypothetical protein
MVEKSRLKDEAEGPPAVEAVDEPDELDVADALIEAEELDPEGEAEGVELPHAAATIAALARTEVNASVLMTCTEPLLTIDATVAPVTRCAETVGPVG